MSFGPLFKHQYPQPRRNVKAPLSEVNTADPIFLVKERMDGSKHAIYHTNLIYLMDKVFIRDNTYFLSIDQERFMNKFFNEAGIVTNRLQNKEDAPYHDMDEIMLQLDSFLGSYFGEDNGRFAR